jgi:methionyl aminopeptidase
MSIETPEDLEGMQRAGQAVRAVLDAMKAAVAVGVSTKDLDDVAAQTMRQHGARSAPKLVYRFPGETCISVNDEVVHGIPGRRKLSSGDLVKLDVTAEVAGYMADAAETVSVGVADRERADLAECARGAFEAAIAGVRPGVVIREVGRRIATHVKARGYSVVRDLCGHGIGRSIHEEPSMPNYADPQATGVLTEGLVITIEPIIAAGRGAAYTARDGWTVRTADRSMAAHYEHTLVVMRGGPMLLTA